MGNPRLALSRKCTVVSDTTFESGGERTLTEALTDAIAEAEGVAPTDLPPLYESVEFDALTQLIEHSGKNTEEGLILAFQIRKWNVFVSIDGRIRVCDATIETDLEPIFAG
ncbi:HalOD1 output domain-containing protein [Halobaculum halobium]|uniref:HalOD1 output domain-containing protein n=1 Tax=Halobaculum halobium TaxID=3032281 RepID=A0ABD5TA92_9EURY|nr:HalOD1 output domain-containing protein [Halobaculum sp. SYNS20]